MTPFACPSSPSDPKSWLECVHASVHICMSTSAPSPLHSCVQICAPCVVPQYVSLTLLVNSQVIPQVIGETSNWWWYLWLEVRLAIGGEASNQSDTSSQRRELQSYMRHPFRDGHLHSEVRPPIGGWLLQLEVRPPIRRKASNWRWIPPTRETPPVGDEISNRRWTPLIGVPTSWRYFFLPSGVITIADYIKKKKV